MAGQRALRVGVPAGAPISAEMESAEYSSAFELGTNARRRPAEWWARAVFEGAPAVVRAVVALGWRLVLRLRLGTADDHVLGWRIVERKPDVVVLEAVSPLLRAQNIVVTTESAVTWSTLVRFDRPIARPIWAVVRPFHHLTIPYLLRRADHGK
ncbi:DUF2867 domain-containing protein [Nocardia sp. CDC159]|uniref:DUF2867 domain-containing protein n=1 Tax=Nocardia pulmonis TaxID=2951408 RepID=A0A9X2IWX4_9NOCA|nr:MULTISPECIES: DUF2867 domain-containing protein [Nocardia]MCM6774024.1 DUF2867 domain-containing protein [Nocardia pulmonis]MCM6786911.1 DUF2867 domain-containing protein [Nocardia sp. CDC159]